MNSARLLTRFVQASAAFGIGAFIAKLVSLLKERTIAGAFGVDLQLDVVLVSILLPNALTNCLIATFCGALIPYYLREAQTKSAGELAKLATNGLTFVFMLAIASAVASIVLTPALLPLYAVGFSQHEINTSGLYAVIYAPTIVFSGVAIYLSALLNANGNFFRNSLTAVALPLVTIACVVLLSERAGAFSIIIGSVFGALAQMIWVGHQVRQKKLLHHLTSLRTIRPPQQVLAQYLPAVLGAALMASTEFIAQSFATLMDPGSISALNYGYKIVALAATLSVTAVSAVALAQLSELVAAKSAREVRSMSRKLAAVLMLVGSIAAIVLHVLAQPLVSLLFETGNFTAQDTVTVSSIHSVYAFHIPFFLAGMFYVRLLNSLQANWLVMLGAGANLVASLIAYPLLVDYFGVIGVAAGPVVIYATSVTVLALSAEYSLRLRIRHFEQTQRVQT